MMGGTAAITATRTLDRAERAVADALARRLAAAYPQDLLEVRVFGSRARGDHREDSDLDVAVIVANPRPRRTDILDLARAAEDEGGYPHLVDPHPHTLKDFRYFQATNSLYYRTMRDDGVTIWRKPGVDLWDEKEVQPMGRELDVEQELRKAHQDLQMAGIALDAQMLDGAGPSAYYAAFHAVKAALLTRGLEAKTHRGVQTLFSQHLVKSGAVPPHCSTWLSNLEAVRNHADYPDAWEYEPLERDEVEKALEHSRSMVADLERLCRDWLERQRSEPGS